MAGLERRAVDSHQVAAEVSIKWACDHLLSQVPVSRFVKRLPTVVGEGTYLHVVLLHLFRGIESLIVGQLMDIYTANLVLDSGSRAV
jgi:hypothetical protein